MIEINKKWD